MTNILLLGAGTIGRMIALLLTRSGDYRVRVGDTDPEALSRLQKKLGVETMVQTVAPSAITHLVTDSLADAVVLDQLRAVGVQVHVAPVPDQAET